MVEAGAARRAPDAGGATAAREPGTSRRLYEQSRSVGLAAWKPVLAGLAVLTAALVLAGVVVSAVDPVDRADLDMLERLLELRRDWLDRPSELATQLAETLPVIVLTALAAWWAYRTWRHMAAPLFVVVAVSGEKLIYLVSSLIIGRDRPPVDTLSETYATASFPSGHVGAAVTLYGSVVLLVALCTSRRGLTVVLGILAAAIVVVVGFCRMYRGFHYPFDVAAGLALGTVWLWWCWHVWTTRVGLGPPTVRRGSRAAMMERASGSAEGAAPGGAHR
jgi:undecaprenyl-diphosphatase